MTRARYRTVAAIVYLVVISGLAWGLIAARKWAARNYSDDAAQQQWQLFRNDVARQTERSGPVTRRVPRSTEPPALVLMRDHFAACSVIALVLTTALYATLAFLVGGAMVTRQDERSQSSG
jgi:hypothetical protein